MAWSKEPLKKSTDHPATQPVVGQPTTAVDHLQNAGVLYAKAGACFEGIYNDLTQGQQAGTQALVDTPTKAADHLQNAGNLYAKAAQCFEGIYASIALQEQQGRSI